MLVACRPGRSMWTHWLTQRWRGSTKSPGGRSGGGGIRRQRLTFRATVSMRPEPWFLQPAMLWDGTAPGGSSDFSAIGSIQAALRKPQTISRPEASSGEATPPCQRRA